MSISAVSWHVVQTRPRSENKAALHLQRQGFEVYLPRYLKRRSHARKVDFVPAPLFPQYVFVAVDLADPALARGEFHGRRHPIDLQWAASGRGSERAWSIVCGVATMRRVLSSSIATCSRRVRKFAFATGLSRIFWDLSRA